MTTTSIICERWLPDSKERRYVRDERFRGFAMAMSGAERQRRYRERHHDDPRASRSTCAPPYGIGSTGLPGLKRYRAAGYEDTV
jgi:hypothetical protein